MGNLQSFKLVIVSAFVALSVSACATNRSDIIVAAPVGEQPKSSSYAKITEVRDLRQFSVNPKDPSQPSLGSAEEIQDPKITGRALARKRNGFGMALGDVTLPQTMTVAGLVRDSAKKALQDRGYVVVEESSPDYARALPLSIDIQQFWTWIHIGFSELTFTFNSTLNLTGPGLLVSDPAVATSQALHTSAFGTESNWTLAIQKGINETTEQIKARINPAANPAAISQATGGCSSGYRSGVLIQAF